jgi:hypothetical protein
MIITEKNRDMKKIFVTIVFSLFLLTIPLLMLAQNPPHPNGGNAPGSGNTPVGGSAPIGSGLITLLIAGVLYGSRKTFTTFRSKM